MNKLRALYDRLYVGGEVWVLGLRGIRANRALAATMPKNPRVEQEYSTAIRPYWRQFKVRPPKKFWFRLLCNEYTPFSPKYIPDDLWRRRIVPHYNDLILARAWQDKCLHSILFPDVKRPVTVVKNMGGEFYDDGMNLLTPDQAAALCHGRGRILVKPSVGSGGGSGIRFYDSDSLTDGQIRDIFRLYGKNFLIQEKMGQHETLAALNPRSLNTIRVITFLREGQVHILTAFIRVGAGDNEVDNTSRGGYKCTVGPGGRLMEYAITKVNGRQEYTPVHPTGARFADVQIPSWSAIEDTVRTLAARMAHFRLIGWDIAVDPEGVPTLIEFNVIPAPGYGTGGPLFGEMTDQVLEEVFGRRKRRQQS